jgi:hypothetical protein
MCSWRAGVSRNGASSEDPIIERRSKRLTFFACVEEASDLHREATEDPS